MPNDSARDWGKRAIKGVTTEQLEDAIAEAIRKLTGENDYEVTIAAIDLAPKGVGVISDTADIRLRVEKSAASFIREKFGRSDTADPTAAKPS
jgi:hypothetical protein